MAPKIRRTAQDIEALADDAAESSQNLSGMSYQEGIVDTCRWLLEGYDAERPLEEV